MLTKQKPNIHTTGQATGQATTTGDEMKLRREWRVSGRVQGVWFRGATRQQALQLGLSCVARNLHDGSVQVIAEGSDDALRLLAQWLKQGPDRARVDAITEIDPPAGNKLDSGFQVD